MSEARTKTLRCDRCGQQPFHMLAHANGSWDWVCPNCGGFYKSPEIKQHLANQAQQGFEQAVAEGDELDQLLARVRREPDGMLPTELRAEDGVARANPTSIVAPDGKDVVDLGRPYNTCGECKYFDLEKGREEIARQGLGKALVQDYEWQIRHLGAPLDQLGLCGASGGQTLTSVVARSCDQFRRRN